MSRGYRRGPTTTRANLTPMIDVTFLLIVFFVLVSQIVEVENVAMRLPEPEDPASSKMSDATRAVINLVPAGDGSVVSYRLGQSTFDAGADGREAMRQSLTGLYSINRTLQVNLRADRATRYDEIEPVLQLVSDAAASVGEDVVPRINLVVLGES